MNKHEIIERLKNIAGHAVHTVDEEPFIMSLDDGIAVHEAIEILGKSELKRGKWILDGHHVRCDQCGIYMCNTDREGDPIPRFFCPNCGADMREVTE